MYRTWWCAWMILAGCGSNFAKENLAVCEDYVSGLCGATSMNVPYRDWPFTSVFANCTVFETEPFNECDMTPFFDCLSKEVTTCDNPDDWPYTRDTSVYEAAETCAAKLSCAPRVEKFFEAEDTAYYEDCQCEGEQVCVLEGVEIGVAAESCHDLPEVCATTAATCAADGTLGDDDLACVSAVCPSSAIYDCIDGKLWFACSVL